MLHAFAVHSGADLSLEMKGDLEVDCHHTVEDVGIVLGQALAACLGDRSGIARYGSFYLPMDESLAFCALVAVHAGLTLHLRVLYGENDHHKIEAVFKAFAHALKGASARTEGGILSSKGVL